MRRNNSDIRPEPSVQSSAHAVRSFFRQNTSQLWIAIICLAAILALAGAVEPAYAGTINVNSTAQRGSGTTGVCTIGAAIIAANTNAVVDGCTGATAAPNTIILPAGTYTLTAVDNTGSFGLPIQMIQWVVICYVLTYASLMLAFGRVGDIFRRMKSLRPGFS